MGEAGGDDPRQRRLHPGRGKRNVRARNPLPRSAHADPGGTAWNPSERCEAIRQLRDGELSIEVRPNTNDGLELGVWMLEPGEAEIVGRSLREILKRA